MSDKSLQEQYAPHNKCFGCGPSNDRGLRVRSFVRGEEVVAEWTPQPQYEAFEGILSGGIIGTLLDCHCNWAAAWHLMRRTNKDSPPCTVTAEYKIEMKSPTPSNGPLNLRAWIVESSDRKAVVAGELSHNGQVTATCHGVFVAVKPGHPAYHRW